MTFVEYYFNFKILEQTHDGKLYLFKLNRTNNNVFKKKKNEIAFSFFF
jgi:hypothetical protein